MITTKKMYELFETGFLMQRQNPGGSSPYLKGYLLGFAGTVNILDALDPATKKGEIKLKIGNGEVQTRAVNFGAAVPVPSSPEQEDPIDPEEEEETIALDLANLTPAQAAAVLQAAGFADCKFSVDEETNRLKLAPLNGSVRWMQIYGDLAAALGFGNCKLGEGKGCFLWASFDGDLKTAAETENWEENKEIVNDSPLGTPVKYTIPGKRSGTNIVLTDRIASRLAKQMINGGIWKGGTVDEPETYEPPAPDNNEPRNVDVFTYSNLMDKYNNNQGSEAFVRERMYVGCVGSMKRSGGGGSFSDSEYSLTANSYTGEDGKEHASPKESDYTPAQWEALGMKGVVVADWENA